MSNNTIRKHLTRFRLSSHNLLIELGKYRGTDREKIEFVRYVIQMSLNLNSMFCYMYAVLNTQIYENNILVLTHGRTSICLRIVYQQK